MGQLKSIQVDPQLQTDGIWVDYFDDIRLKIARLGTDEYLKYVRRLRKPHERRIRREGETTSKVLQKLVVKAVATKILVDWEGMEEQKVDENGEKVFDGIGDPVLIEVPYSAEKAEEYMADISFRDFYEDVIEISNTAENYYVEQLEESEGNSGSASNGA